MNYDAALGERGLKFWAKAPSRTARKCGEATFITQTSERVSDQLLLSNAFTAMNGFTPQTPIEVALPASKTWKFTRKRSHLTYNLATRRALSSVEPGQPIPIYAEEQSWRQLLLPQIVAKLYSAHGNNGTVEVWKEVLISLGSGKGTHHVRGAFHQYDGYGAYFDWVNVKDSIEETEVDYVPAKALLLYQFRDECYCLCWKAQRPTSADRKQETNISARWKMQFRSNGSPAIDVVPMEDVHQAIFVYQHFRNLPYHFPQTAATPHDRSTLYVIDEVYERYSWALNYLDQQRWVDE